MSDVPILNSSLNLSSLRRSLQPVCGSTFDTEKQSDENENYNIISSFHGEPFFVLSDGLVIDIKNTLMNEMYFMCT